MVVIVKTNLTHKSIFCLCTAR